MQPFFLITYLAALAAGYFYPALSGALLLTERDLAVFFIPPRVLWTNIVKHGEFPLWNPYSFCGHPLFATLQTGVLYPPNVLLLLLPFDAAFNWVIVLHFFLGGLFAYLLLRELHAGLAGSLTGALTFMLSGYLFSVHNVISTLLSAVWAPLVITLFIRTMRRGSFFYAMLTGCVLAAMFMAGGVETLYATIGVLAFIMLLPHTLDMDGAPEARRPLKSRILLMLAATSVFLALSAVQLLPFLELARLSTREFGLSFQEATIWSFDLKDFIQFILPDPFGYLASDDKYWANQSWLKTVYTGSIPFILSLFFFLDKRRRALLFSVLGLSALSLAMGHGSLVYLLLFKFAPFFNKIRYPVKFLSVVFVLLSISAGLGFDSLVKGIEADKAVVRRAVLALLALATVAAIVFGAAHYFDARIKGLLVERGIDAPEYNHIVINVFNAKRALFFFITASALIYGALRSIRVRRVFPYALILLLSIDLFFAHNGYFIATRAVDYHRMGEAMDFFSKDTAGLFRVFVTPRTLARDAVSLDAGADAGGASGKRMNLDKEKLIGYNMEHGIFSIDGVEVMRRMDHAFVYGLMASQKRPDSTNMLQMMNVKYVVSVPKIRSREFRLRKIIAAGALHEKDEKKLEGMQTLKIYENLNYLPRFFVVEGFQAIKRPEEYAAILSDKGFNPAKTVLVEEDLKLGARVMPEIKKNTVEVMRYMGNSIELKAACRVACILVASESWYPDWKVYVDGKEGRLLKADLLLRAVVLAPGIHDVKFAYSPRSFRYGAYVSATALLFVFAGAVYLARGGN